MNILHYILRNFINIIIFNLYNYFFLPCQDGNLVNMKKLYSPKRFRLIEVLSTVCINNYMISEFLRIIIRYQLSL